MSIKFEVYKNNNAKSSAFGKYFARTVFTQIVGTDKLADLIQQNVSVKEADVYAVLKELKNAVRQAFDGGNAVRIEGLGIFKPSISTRGADKAADFSANNVKKARIVFVPETVSENVMITRTIGGQQVEIATKVRMKKLLQGIKFAENRNYTSPSAQAAPAE